MGPYRMNSHGRRIAIGGYAGRSDKEDLTMTIAINNVKRHARQYASSISIDRVQEPKEVIHPALDWVNGELIVGVPLDGEDAVLASKRGLIHVKEAGEPCKTERIHNSSVTRDLARKHEEVINGKALQEDMGSKLLERIANHLKKFVVFPEEWYPEMVASWILGTYVYPAFQTYPYLRLTSAEPGCGKSVLGGLIANLCFNGEFMSSPNEAQLYRLADSNRGVQVWDEVEVNDQASSKRFTAIKPILLCGYRNAGAVPRQAGKAYDKTERFHLYCPRVFIGLSRLPNVAAQRTITIEMKKCNIDGYAEYYVADDNKATEEQLRADSILWALSKAGDVADAYRSKDLRETVIKVVSDVGRQSDDVWLPLFSVATTAQKTTSVHENSFLKELTTAAQKFVHARANEAEHPTKSVTGSSDQSAKKEEPDPNEGLALRGALDMLKWKKEAEPGELVKVVSQKLGIKVSSQRLGKGLSKLGIKSSPRGRKRLFAPTSVQLEKAYQLLGDDPRQEIQQIQEQEEGEREIEDNLVSIE
jgi:hypothetical protein